MNPIDEWKGMPTFTQEKQKPHALINVRFENEEDLQEFATLIGQKLTNKTKSIWHPKLERGKNAQKRWVGDLGRPLRYPVYIVSKGRHSNMLTDKALDRLGIKYTVVVEADEYLEYSARCGADNVLILPQKYLDEYDTCDEKGESQSKGPGAARNFCIDHSLSHGFKRHWVLDDNLDDFHRLHLNVRAPVRTNATFVAAEDFVDRYLNVPVAGMNYYSFCKTTDAVPPFVMNTRIYSCLLIDGSAGYRWRGRYNEDTDLSLRVLKDGFCTIQFNSFLCGKVTTQRMRGGNSKEFYDEEGTKPKSQMIKDLHPDVSKVVRRFNRWHHQVNYKPFKGNALIPCGADVEEGDNNYNMTLVDGVVGK